MILKSAINSKEEFINHHSSKIIKNSQRYNKYDKYRIDDIRIN